jgi:hypothetical protein
MDRTTIDAALGDLERSEHVRVLYACESGSRAWGFPSADSDFDVRFIFVRPREAYLRLNPPRDTIEPPIDGVLDLSGWDLYKACRLLRKMNPPLLEWLGSPIVYREAGPAAQVMREQAAAHFNRRACCEHYLSMARRNMQAYIAGRQRVRKKKYLYALRPLICLQWLLQRGTFPPTRFQDVMAGLEIEPDLRAAIGGLIEAKQDERESAEVTPIPDFDAFITAHLESTPKVLHDIPGRPFPTDGLDVMIAEVLAAGATSG